MKRRVAIVGTVVIDQIERPQAPPTRGLGGIAYSVAALADLAGDSVEIVPVCRVGADLESELARRWQDRTEVRLEGLLPCPGPHTRVRLDYTRPGLAPGERREILQHPLAPLRAAELGAIGEVDLVLVNLVSGFDLELEALQWLAARAPVYLDVHSLALDRLDDGTRTPRHIVDAQAWAQCADWLQCNRREAEALGAGDDAAAGLASLLRVAVRPRCALLTLGADGALLIEASGRVAPAIAAAASGDPTGAGDTFGAAFVGALLAGCDEIEAVGRAVVAGTAACEFEGVPPPGALSAALRCC